MHKHTEIQKIRNQNQNYFIDPMRKFSYITKQTKKYVCIYLHVGKNKQTNKHLLCIYSKVN